MPHEFPPFVTSTEGRNGNDGIKLWSEEFRLELPVNYFTSRIVNTCGSSGLELKTAQSSEAF